MYRSFLGEIGHLIPSNILNKFREELENGKDINASNTRIPERSDGVGRDKWNTDSNL